MGKIKFAVIGINSIGQRHMEGILDNIDAELVAVCDNDSEVLNKVADKFHIEARYLDYRDLLDKNLIDAVCVATPDQVHRDMVIDFCVKSRWLLIQQIVRL